MASRPENWASEIQFCYPQKVTRYLSCVLAVAGLATGQQANQQQQQNQQQTQPQPTPLFGGKLGVRSSQKTKESATLGFNGIDPSGKVDKQMLATTPSATDQEKVQKMDQNRPTAADLNAFLTEGELTRQ